MSRFEQKVINNYSCIEKALDVQQVFDWSFLMCGHYFQFYVCYLYECIYWPVSGCVMLKRSLLTLLSQATCSNPVISKFQGVCCKLYFSKSWILFKSRPLPGCLYSPLPAIISTSTECLLTRPGFRADFSALGWTMVFSYEYVS